MIHLKYMFNSVYCPKNEDHISYAGVHRKIMFLFDNDGILIHCKLHGWIRFRFERGGKKISFDNVAIKAIDVKNDKHLDIQEAPVIAVGEFPRRGKCQNSKPREH